MRLPPRQHQVYSPLGQIYHFCLPLLSYRQPTSAFNNFWQGYSGEIEIFQKSTSNLDRDGDRAIAQKKSPAS
ncbi:hypothetical protein [Lusitaniella coriacea]|uniref:hypothetical protein n=1 Tax=Lusitaniella coriacea TaxID=1983105 RepID=UPI003CF19FDB